MPRNRDAARDFIRRCFNLLNSEDVFGYSLEPQATSHHGRAYRHGGGAAHAIRLTTDQGNVIITAENVETDPYAHLTADQVAKLREAALQRIVSDLNGADDSTANFWAEMYLQSNPQNAAMYLDVMAWDERESTDQWAEMHDITFNPKTGKPIKRDSHEEDA